MGWRRWSNTTEAKGEEEKILSQIFLKEEKDFYRQRIREVFEMEDPACARVETTGRMAQSGNRQNGRLHLLCICGPQPRVNWSHFAFTKSTSASFRRPSLLPTSHSSCP